jgi:hypothetical protein
MIGNLRDVAFGEKQTLWSTKATEGCVRYGVGLADPTAHINVGDLIDTVDMRQASLDNGTRQILGMATVGEYVGVESKDLSFLGNTDLPLAEERVALAGCQDILITVEHASNGSVKLLRGSSTDSSQLDRACFLATESTSKSLDTRNNLVGGDTTDLSDVCLAI